MVTCATIINMGIFKKVIIFTTHHPFILIIYHSSGIDRLSYKQYVSRKRSILAVFKGEKT